MKREKCILFLCKRNAGAILLNLDRVSGSIPLIVFRYSLVTQF